MKSSWRRAARHDDRRMGKVRLQSNVVAALVVGAFGVVTLKLGLGKFRSEKWWERKSAAYIALIEALHATEAYAKAVIAESGGEFEFSDEAKVSLHDASLAGENEIRKFNTIGALVLSQKASMILQFFVK